MLLVNCDMIPWTLVTAVIPLVISCFLLQDIGESVTKDLSQHEDILNYCFTLLAHDKTYLMACQFLEDMLQARRQVLNLNSIGRSAWRLTLGLPPGSQLYR